MRKHIKKIAYVFVIVAMLLFCVSLYVMFQIDKKIKAGLVFVSDNTYIDKYEISKTSFSELKTTLLDIEDTVLAETVIITVNERDYEYTLKELGIEINKEELEKSILDYEESKDYYSRYNSISKGEYETKKFNYEYKVNDELLREFVNLLSLETDVEAKNGKLVMNSNKELSYTDEVIGFKLDVEKSVEVLKLNFSSKDYLKKIELVGDKVYTTDKLKTINKKISTFSTTFDTSLRRKYNLETAAGYVNGTILYPGEYFSFYSKAAPFNKAGYVYYDGVLANGVCQVATTIYNAQLLAGLKTVTRYNHGTLPVYVKGGLDATVAETRGFITDYKFQNNFEYPIYISSYVKDGKVTVDIWSNENATHGVTYKTESISLGHGGYSAYRYGYKDGEQVSKEYLGNSYYIIK